MADPTQELIERVRMLEERLRVVEGPIYELREDVKKWLTPVDWVVVKPRHRGLTRSEFLRLLKDACEVLDVEVVTDFRMSLDYGDRQDYIDAEVQEVSVWVGDEVYTTSPDDHIKFNTSTRWDRLSDNKVLHVLTDGRKFVMLKRKAAESRKRTREDSEFLLDEEKEMMEEMDELQMTFLHNGCLREFALAKKMGWIFTTQFSLRVMASVKEVEGRGFKHEPTRVQIECEYSHPKNKKPCRFFKWVDWDKFPERMQLGVMRILAVRGPAALSLETVDRIEGWKLGYYLAFQPSSKRHKRLSEPNQTE